MNENRQNFLKQNAGTILIVVLAGLGFWVYSAFLQPQIQGDLSQSDSGVVQDVIRTLDRLEKISLDSSIFASPEFQRLKTFELVIPSFVVGKSNPFTPFR